jgi:transposase InsO family protein
VRFRIKSWRDGTAGAGAATKFSKFGHAINTDEVFGTHRLARQITEAFPWTSAPAYLVRDNDGAYGHVFKSRVRAMGIRDRPISPGSPWQNGYAKRLIGAVRRECLDRMLIFDESHLRRVLASYAAYYNRARTHLALQKDASLHRAVQRSGVIVAIPILSGLHHQYVRI